jgi:hypothetical protein
MKLRIGYQIQGGEAGKPDIFLSQAISFWCFQSQEV